MRALGFLLCAALSQAVMAGPWEATDAQGLSLRITHETFRARDAYVLTRSFPDGSVDTGFGQQGSILFSLGPDNEGPAALRVDPTGRIWIAGATAGRGDTLQAVVMRFLAHGAADAAYAEGGRSAVAPAGLKARALDIAPQSDGSCFVVGTVLDGQGTERTGWWRLGPDGRVDTRFGLGGLWSDPQGGPAEVVELVAGTDGSLGLGIRRGDSVTSQLEAWVLAPGQAAPVLLQRSRDDPGAQLVWQGGRWRWVARGQALPTAAAMPAAHPAPASKPQAGAALAPGVTPIPPGGAAPASASAAAAASAPSIGGESTYLIPLLLAGIAVAALGAALIWRRLRVTG